MQGLWVAVVTADHATAYDPAIGKVTGHERWQVGAIVSHFEGDDTVVPDAGSERVGGKMYRWLFYAGRTEAELKAFLAMGVDPNDPGALKGNLRILGYASGMQKRAGAALAADVSVAAGMREADERALSGS